MARPKNTAPPQKPPRKPVNTKPIRSAWRDWAQVAMDLPLLMLPALVLMAVRFGGPHWWI